MTITELNQTGPEFTEPHFSQSPEFHDWIIDILKMHVVNLHFTKKDGSLRIMNCTKDLTRIPVEMHPKDTGRKGSTESVPVFDIDLQQWRSFTTKNVVQVNFDVSQ